MKTFKLSFQLAALVLFATGVFTGCESTDGSGTRSSSNAYYGVGFNNPWYYGENNYNDGNVATPPPASRPPDQDLRPTHPIAPPSNVSRPAPRPTPSIPSAPRPSPRPARR